MWDSRKSQRNTLYAPAADHEDAPLREGRPTRWQRTKSWVRDRPVATALIALIVVGGIIAVIAAPVITSQRNRNKDGEVTVQGIDFKMTFQVQNASQLCSNFKDANFLNGYATTLQTSIASIIAVQPSQVAIQSVQCGSDSFSLGSSGSRRLLQSTDGSSGISIVVTFRVSPPSNGSASGSGGGSSADKLPEPDQAASQLQSSSLVLQQLLSQALGLPASNVVLISVVASQGGTAAQRSPPPLGPPAGPPPVPGPPAVSASPLMPSPPPGVVPAVYSSPPGSWYPPPVYGPYPPPSSSPSQSLPVYGGGNNRRR